MVVDPKDVIPFFKWLLGPAFEQGVLFQPWPLVLCLIFLGGALSWLVIALRRGSSAPSHRAAFWLGGGILLAIVFIAGLAGLMAILANLFPEQAEQVGDWLTWFLTWLLGESWYQGALYRCILVFSGATALVYVVGCLAAVLRNGPTAGLTTAGQMISDCLFDIVRLSPWRTWALARLALQESIRRRVVVVFAMFILVLLFAGWFLDPGSNDPARLYLDFVLTATSYLVLLLVLFLSSLSFPADIKNRTLHTVVTKPVRSSEVVLGRIVGFVAVGTLLLTVMGLISYVFVVRGVAHTHQLTAEDLRPAEGATAEQKAVLYGRTSRVHQHRHKVTIDADPKKNQVEMEQRHTHELSVQKDGDKVAYHLGGPKGMLVARVPVYGKLTFRDRTGQPTDKGVNVGDEWTYRSYIEGGSLGACVWTFDGITEEVFPHGLPVELTIEVFRTYKANIEKGVLGSLTVRNPRTGKKVEVEIFQSKEYMTDSRLIPRDLQMPDGKTVDLFRDFVDDGKVEIWLRCVDPQQYFGAAQADMYLRAPDASFALNFIKGYFGIWLQMLLLIAMGVLFSTFLSGPVAILATGGALLGAFFNDFMYRLATGQTYGGGPVESLIRIWTQQNVTSQMDPSLQTTVAQTLDQAAKTGLWALAWVLPDFSRFNFAEFVASGFNISGDTILIYTCRAFAFAGPVFIAAYLCLKNREIGK